jgi:hypothetical protein
MDRLVDIIAEEDEAARQKPLGWHRKAPCHRRPGGNAIGGRYTSISKQRLRTTPGVAVAAAAGVQTRGSPRKGRLFLPLYVGENPWRAGQLLRHDTRIAPRRAGRRDHRHDTVANRGAQKCRDQRRALAR